MIKGYQSSLFNVFCLSGLSQSCPLQAAGETQGENVLCSKVMFGSEGEIENDAVGGDAERGRG